MESDSKIQVALTPICVGVDAVSALCGVCRKTVYQMLKEGRFGPVPVQAFGRRTLWRRSDIEAWAAAGFPRRTDWLVLQAKKNENPC